MPAASPDRSGPNAAEREALGLLAAGHTAKSIATLTGRNEGAVNERLRDARRKTGVGSSRELARLLREQETRDEQIGWSWRPWHPQTTAVAPMDGGDAYLKDLSWRSS